MADDGTRREVLHFALRNTKLRIGIAHPGLLRAAGGHRALSHVLPTLIDRARPMNHPPSRDNWFGTTSFGEDVFTQFVHGLGATFLVGLMGGGLGTLLGVVIGFVAGYRGGIVDELLNMSHQHRSGDPLAGGAPGRGRLSGCARLSVRKLLHRMTSPGHGPRAPSARRPSRCGRGSLWTWRA